MLMNRLGSRLKVSSASRDVDITFTIVGGSRRPMIISLSSAMPRTLEEAKTCKLPWLHAIWMPDLPRKTTTEVNELTPFSCCYLSTRDCFGFLRSSWRRKDRINHMTFLSPSIIFFQPKFLLRKSRPMSRNFLRRNICRDETPVTRGSSYASCDNYKESICPIECLIIG